MIAHPNSRTVSKPRVASDQMLATGEALKSALEPCGIIDATEGEITRNPEVIIAGDTGLDVGDQGRIRLIGRGKGALAGADNAVVGKAQVDRIPVAQTCPHGIRQAPV